MSLAVSGGGGLTVGGGGGAAAGGLGSTALMHDASGSAPGQLATQGAAQAPPMTEPQATSSGTSGGWNTDFVVTDKSQKQLSRESVKRVAALPLVGMDVWSAAPTVAYYPPKTPFDHNRQMEQQQTAGVDPDMVYVYDLQPALVGKMKASLRFHATEGAHKALRKYLTSSKPYDFLRQEHVFAKASDVSANGSNSEIVALEQPYAWLGVRRFDEVSEELRRQAGVENTSAGSNNSATASAIAEESTASATTWWTQSTLDGAGAANDDDFDRVVAKVRLHTSKKALTILPEEATGLIFHQARYHAVARYESEAKALSEARMQEAEQDGLPTTGIPPPPKVPTEDILECAMSLALPSWCFADSYMEALLEAAGIDSPTCVWPRSVAAVVASVARHPQQPFYTPQEAKAKNMTSSPLFVQLSHTFQQKSKPERAFIVTASVLPQAVELSLVEVSQPIPTRRLCPFEQVQVVTHVAIALPTTTSSNSNGKSTPASSSYLSESVVQPALLQALNELHDWLDTHNEDQQESMASGHAGIACMMLYGTVQEQELLSKILTQTYVPQLAKKSKSTKPLCAHLVTSPAEGVAMGAALLGGIAHGRVITKRTASASSKATKKKTVFDVAVKVPSTALTAVALSISYNANDYGTTNDGVTTTEPSWTPLKTIFDFDRRLPAEYRMEFKAADSVVHRRQMLRNAKANKAGTQVKTDMVDDDEVFLKTSKQYAAARRYTGYRREAALNTQVQLYQKMSRHGPWIKLGDPMEPLVKTVDKKNPDVEVDSDIVGEENCENVPCEETTVEWTMLYNGTLSVGLQGTRESVEKAVQTARWSKIEAYAWGIGAILFFGGFFVKSYWEDYVWKRDTARLLKYYEYVLPGSIHDGDHQSARMIAYKYRHKKDALWERLETKYGVPVLYLHEWDDYVKDHPDLVYQKKTKSKSSKAENKDGEDDDDEILLDEDDDEDGSASKKKEEDTKEEASTTTATSDAATEEEDTKEEASTTTATSDAATEEEEASTDAADEVAADEMEEPPSVEEEVGETTTETSSSDSEEL